ncbi:MAG: hypothetical protein L0G99_04750 [Propionibacteriales bacterium]|nr:hypothetical protein [Propionibacteriales bacterium]
MGALLLLLLILVQALQVRSGLNALSARLALRANVWDQVIGLAYDPYLMVYLLLPLTMILAARRARHHVARATLIRSGSHLTWLRGAARRAVCDVAPLVGCWVLAIVASSAGLRVTSGWSPLALLGEPGQQFADVVGLGLAPAGAAVANLMLCWATLVSFHLIISTSALFHHVATPWMVAAGLWVWTLVTFRALPDILWFNFSAGLQLHRAIGLFGWGFLFPTLTLIISAFAICAGLDGWTRRRRSLQAVHLLTTIWALLAIVSLVAWTSVTPASTWAEALTTVLYGSGTEPPQLTSYAMFVIVFLGLPFAYGVQLESSLAGHLPMVTIRSGSLITWAWRQLRSWLLISAITPAAAGMVVALTWWVGQSASGMEDQPSIPVLLFQILVNGPLQIVLNLVLVLLVRWISGSPAAPALVVGALTVAGAFGGGRVPAVLNSAAYVLLGWPHVLIITAALLGLLALVVTALMLILHRRLCLERAIA